MTTATRDHTQTALEAELEAEGCPECGHLSYVVTEAYSATRVDPACWEGHCTCAEKRAEVCDGTCMDEECCPCDYED